MSNTLTYLYPTPSNIVKTKTGEELFLSKYSEVQKKDTPCFFWGKLVDPYHTSKCLITLAQVVKSSFSLSPADLAALKDPIVTAGNERIRFEAFSHCAGAYARVDILPNGHDGEFLDTGTTNVDFNSPMISALGSVQKNHKFVMSVGKKEFTVSTEGKKVVERKVPLPTKWLKGLSTVQIYLADTELVHTFNKPQAIQLMRTVPKKDMRRDYYLTIRGNKPSLSPVPSKNALCVGGAHRLRLIEHLMPLADKVQVYTHPKALSTTWQLYFGTVVFSLSISRDSWRGYSGEGAALESLIDEVPDDWIEKMDNLSYSNQFFNPTSLAIDRGLSLTSVETTAAKLAAIGLLGFDLDENHYFYRRLPFKLSRILSLNPRLKSANKLIEDGKVKIISQTDGKVEARVQGTGVEHSVLLEYERERCTCMWFAKHHGDRGVCKHVLAVKKVIK